MYSTIPRKISKLYDDDDVLYSLHSTHSPCRQQLHHRCLDGYHVEGAECCLIGIILGVTMKKDIAQ